MNEVELDYIREHFIPPEIKRQGVCTLDFTTKSHTKGWQKMKEFTSSSKSGIHFGHYICRSHDYTLASMDAFMARIPAFSVHSPERWQHGINVVMKRKKTRRETSA